MLLLTSLVVSATTTLLSGVALVQYYRQPTPAPARKKRTLIPVTDVDAEVGDDSFVF